MLFLSFKQYALTDKISGEDLTRLRQEYDQGYQFLTIKQNLWRGPRQSSQNKIFLEFLFQPLPANRTQKELVFGHLNPEDRHSPRKSFLGPGPAPFTQINRGLTRYLNHYSLLINRSFNLNKEQKNELAIMLGLINNDVLHNIFLHGLGREKNNFLAKLGVVFELLDPLHILFGFYAKNDSLRPFSQEQYLEHQVQRIAAENLFIEKLAKNELTDDVVAPTTGRGLMLLGSLAYCTNFRIDNIKENTVGQGSYWTNEFHWDYLFELQNPLDFYTLAEYFVAGSKKSIPIFTSEIKIPLVRP